MRINKYKAREKKKRYTKYGYFERGVTFKHVKQYGRKII